MGTLDKLQAAKASVENRYYDLENDLKRTKNELVGVNLQIKHLVRYYANKKVYERYQSAEDKDAFRAEHRSQIETYEESVKALDELLMGEDYPSLKVLRERKTELTAKRDRLQAEYRPVATDMRNMKVVWKNVCFILGRDSDLEKDRPTRPTPDQPERQRRRRREMSL